MRFNPTILSREDKTTGLDISQPTNVSDALAAARAKIECEFSALAKQDPRLLRLALNEAEGLAWATGLPELVFPLLAQEKAAQAASWYIRQNFVRQGGPIQAFAA